MLALFEKSILLDVKHHFAGVSEASKPTTGHGLWRLAPAFRIGSQKKRETEKTTAGLIFSSPKLRSGACGPPPLTFGYIIAGHL